MDCAQYSNEKIVSILRATKELNHLKDVDAILDKILYESRKICNADAGSIFLVEDDNLTFRYVHNDTLFKVDESNAALYVNYSIPIDKTSIVGYVALTGETLAIDDVYALSDTVTYSFNPAFDEKSGYKTTSILTIPLKTFQDKLVGVMELINAKNDMGKYISFTPEHEIYVPLFANNAGLAIERGIMNRELILRMIKIAELRDPSETGAHVQRVGYYAAEIYHSWAIKHKVDYKERKQTLDLIRLAAMLHDVGKVGISDAILKKPGKLTPDERKIMQLHTIYGARLFENKTSTLDEMSREIALGHHEKWKGIGYPGKIENLFASEISMGQPKNGVEIPISARIVAIADVFDALTSRRSYKEPWADEKIFSIFEEESGTHFDPELVEIFFQIFDVIKAIRERYRE